MEWRVIKRFPDYEVRRAWDGDAAPQGTRLAPGAALLIILLASAALWAAMIWGAIALCGAVNG